MTLEEYQSENPEYSEVVLNNKQEKETQIDIRKEKWLIQINDILDNKQNLNRSVDKELIESEKNETFKNKSITIYFLPKVNSNEPDLEILDFTVSTNKDLAKILNLLVPHEKIKLFDYLFFLLQKQESKVLHHKKDALIKFFTWDLWNFKGVTSVISHIYAQNKIANKFFEEHILKIRKLFDLHWDVIDLNQEFNQTWNKIVNTNRRNFSISDKIRDSSQIIHINSLDSLNWENEIILSSDMELLKLLDNLSPQEKVNFFDYLYDLIIVKEEHCNNDKMKVLVDYFSQWSSYGKHLQLSTFNKIYNSNSSFRNLHFKLYIYKIKELLFSWI